MYEKKQIILQIQVISNNIKSLSEIFSFQNTISLLLFLLLTFLGTAGRASIDIELLKKGKIKPLGFLNKWFIATILSYVIEIFISEKEFLRKYYSEVIIFFCIFVNDIIIFIVKNIWRIILYFLNGITKGILDLRNLLINREEQQNKNNDSSSDSK